MCKLDLNYLIVNRKCEMICIPYVVRSKIVKEHPIVFLKRQLMCINYAFIIHQHELSVNYLKLT